MSERVRLLVIDDDNIIVESLSEFLRLEGYEVDGGESVRQALAALERQRYQLVITDVNMAESDGFDLLRTVKDRYPDTVVIMITGYGTIDSAVEAIKLGAYDYLTKPIIDDEIRLVVERAVKQQALIRENQDLRRQLDLRYNLDNIIGHDYQMLKIFDLVEAVADSTTTVLIQGDSGTGKSLIARAIHYRSSRRDKPFVEVSCGALPETLLESELFGHVKGAFTNAMNDKEGKFKAAHQGTIFLDEISTASPALQVKLLRVLQERQFEPVGSNQTDTVETRVILASNRDLSAEVEAGRFRQDLYYRVNVVAIQVPPLRQRIGDIPLLADYFLEKYRKQLHKEILGLTDEALRLMQAYSWKGNVRELENCIERAVVLSKGRYITDQDLPASILEHSGEAAVGEGVYKPASLKEALEDPEKRIIRAALEANHWNRQATAEVLEINRTTLYKKMKRYGLEVEAASAGRRM
ncbi:MAG: sigma-54-dependent Fis family transcriptional regulator [Phycisphaerae bacterium]|nr:sigma-54-dependent Fis family transcriptional regulator [Phycisphaerae bacterium]